MNVAPAPVISAACTDDTEPTPTAATRPNAMRRVFSEVSTRGTPQTWKKRQAAVAAQAAFVGPRDCRTMSDLFQPCYVRDACTVHVRRVARRINGLRNRPFVT